MRRRFVTAMAATLALSGALPIAGCGSEAEEETPSVLRTRFETEMKTILRDLKSAQEMAAVNEGAYLQLEELRARYLNRPIPASYRLSLSDVSVEGFNALIVHEATGLECRLEVGAGEAGVPRCG